MSRITKGFVFKQTAGSTSHVSVGDLNDNSVVQQACQTTSKPVIYARRSVPLPIDVVPGAKSFHGDNSVLMRRDLNIQPSVVSSTPSLARSQASVDISKASLTSSENQFEVDFNVLGSSTKNSNVGKSKKKGNKVTLKDKNDSVAVLPKPIDSLTDEEKEG